MLGWAAKESMSRAVAFELPLGEVVKTNWPGHGCGWILKRENPM